MQIFYHFHQKSSSIFTIASICALQEFVCRTHHIWFSAFSAQSLLFALPSQALSSMRFRAASLISAQYFLMTAREYAENILILSNDKIVDFRRCIREAIRSRCQKHFLRSVAPCNSESEHSRIHSCVHIHVGISYEAKL